MRASASTGVTPVSTLCRHRPCYLQTQLMFHYEPLASCSHLLSSFCAVVGVLHVKIVTMRQELLTSLRDEENKVPKSSGCWLDVSS